MNEYDVYCEYVALKRHFSSATYDYFKYNGKTSASVESYKKRKDRYFFQKLAKEKDPKGLLVSNFVYSDAWIGDILRNQESEAIYTKWKRVNQALTYHFENDLSRLNSLKEEIDAEQKHPEIFSRYYRGEIYLETLVILMDVLRCESYWKKNLKDDPLGRQTLQKIQKYKLFVKYDREKMKSIIKKCLISL